MRARARTINDLGYWHWFIVILASVATAIMVGLMVGWLMSTV
jgi:hypothetical protein